MTPLTAEQERELVIRLTVRTFEEALKRDNVNVSGVWINALQARLALEALLGLKGAAPFDFAAHVERAKAFSERTFGPGHRTKGVVDHIRKELLEVEAAPLDLEEWIDVWMLALDGAWRSGATTEQIIAQILAKQTKNEGRKWPDWRTADRDKGIEHDRTADLAAPHRAGLALKRPDTSAPDLAAVRAGLRLAASECQVAEQRERLPESSYPAQWQLGGKTWIECRAAITLLANLPDAELLAALPASSAKRGDE